MNQEFCLERPAGWNDGAKEKLWLYNLHYFDDLNAANAYSRRSWHLELIRRWVRENPPGQGSGWESYPISLRVVNWIKWALAGNELSGEALQSLVVQVRHLRKRLEYHLLGNHLFANAKALIFAGLFFQGSEAEGWLDKGLRILGSELPEQILADGGHFERSPMYHAIILDDLLDLVNLFRTYVRELPYCWENACIRMRTWLKVLTHPDGKIALFNDAAFGVAPSWEDLDGYSGRLGLVRQEYPPKPLTHLPETGYVRCEMGRAMLLLDVAPVGPDYIPGHAHADTLNFELSLFGQRVIVDSGTSTYEKNAERQRQRGTAAHNVASINGENSSEVWGGFRVARRARPVGLKTIERAGKVKVTCSHDGYRRLSGKPIHRREWRLDEYGLVVHDTVEGKFHKAVTRYHFHPDVNVMLEAGGKVQCDLPDGQTFSLQIIDGDSCLVNTTYHPEFNVSIPNQCLEVSFAGPEAQVVISWS